MGEEDRSWESETCVITGVKQISSYPKSQKVPKEDVNHKHKLSQTHEKAFP